MLAIFPADASVHFMSKVIDENIMDYDDKYALRLKS